MLCGICSGRVVSLLQALPGWNRAGSRCVRIAVNAEQVAQRRGAGSGGGFSASAAAKLSRASEDFFLVSIQTGAAALSRRTDDAAHFSRAFRARFRMRPRELRRSTAAARGGGHGGITCSVARRNA